LACCVTTSRVCGARTELFSLAALSAYADRNKGTDLNQFKADRPAVVERLTAKGTADSLAAAAVLKQFGEETEGGSYALAARAVELAPDRRDLAWLAIRLCNIASDCDATMPEQRLRSLDPRNGLGLIGTLTRAQSKSDAAAVDSTLTAMGNSEYFHVYFAPLVAATAPELAMAQHPGRKRPARKDLAQAAVEMIGVMAASVLPPLQPLTLSCKGMALELDGRRERCRAAAQAFERADTFIVEGLGLSLQQHLWPADSPEGRAVAARRRVFQYRLEEYSRFGISSSNFTEFPADIVDVLSTHEREQDAALVYFAKAGVPVDPPANWTSTTPPRVP
jgi:hypothetical protein